MAERLSVSPSYVSKVRARLLAGQIARQASAMTLDAIRRGGAAYDTVRG
ncbi:MAG TPA: hypothetical protein VGN83_11940 [Falsiroseomonas sp.]|nr:hypothetical protein [Falsiroseomonas sp.]